MREIRSEEIARAVAKLTVLANLELPEDLLEAIRDASRREESEAGREVLYQLESNAAIAREDALPVCQDTGLPVVFLEIGQEVHVAGGGLADAVHDGIRAATRDGLLRASVLNDPLRRVNTGDNTPAVIHTEIVPGERIRIVVAPKGGGSENKSALRMLTPAQGAAGVRRFVTEAVAAAGADPCPPLVVGVGIGGSMEKAALLAKKALLRKVGEPSPDPEARILEREILDDLNSLGIGPSGLGGRVTALAVHVEMFACHIASLPVAVNLSCHALRHAEATL